MAVSLDLRSDLRVRGNIRVDGLWQNLERTSITQESLSEFHIPIEDWRVWNAYATLLGTPANDDLGITAGTWGSATPYISCGDVNGDANANRYGRFQVMLPMNYVSGETVNLEFWAGLISGTGSVGTITLDMEVYRTQSATGANVGSADLCATAAQSINTTTVAAYSFDITATALNPGDILDCRANIAFTNNATARVPGIVSARLLCDTKG